MNDSLGHGMGDQLLKAVAQRIASCVPRQEQVARLGGDEFAVLLTDLAEPSDAIIIRTAFSRTFKVPAPSMDKMYLSVRVWAFLSARKKAEELPAGGPDARSRYRSVPGEGGGKGQAVLFTPAMGREAMERLDFKRPSRRDRARRIAARCISPLLAQGPLNDWSGSAGALATTWGQGVVEPSAFIPTC